MPELRDPMPKQGTKPTGGAKSVMPLEPPPTPPRYTADGVWRPASPGWGDRPGERDTRPFPKPTRKARHQTRPLPPLVVQPPLCPICDKEVSHDRDSFWCETCHSSWARDRCDEEGVADLDAEQCPAGVAPHEDGKDPTTVGQPYRSVRHAGHPVDSRPDRHVGVRSDGGVDHSRDRFDWRDGEHPKWQPTDA